MDERNQENSNTQTSVSSSQTTSNSNQPLQTKFEKYLYGQVTLAIAIIATAFGVYAYFHNPQQATDNTVTAIKAEFATHEALQTQQTDTIVSQIELLKSGDIKDLKNDIIENRDEIVKLTNEVVKLETIINERIPAKK